MGETELIERIATRFIGLPTPEAITVVQGVGDDCAVVQVGKQILLLTVDMLVEGVHFRLDWTDPHALGWKALAVNLSDIAAMGGIPALALLSMVLPAQRRGAWLDALIDGIADCARTYGCALVGGDTNRSEQVILDIAVVGTVNGTPVMRSGAQPGDWLMVTGTLGGSRAGLLALMAGTPYQVDLTAHLKPIPRLAEGQIARAAGVHAMMDISDGLSADLPKLLRASGVGAVVSQSAVPVHPAARQWAATHQLDPTVFAMEGGEDYELLLAVAPADAERLQQHMQAQLGTPLTRIGTICAEPNLWLETTSGQRTVWTFKGWDHFSP